jgi:ubiquitin-conjugating enzyme E2 S
LIKDLVTVILGYFVTKIFHPNVSKSGEVCVNTLKKDWNKDSGVERILLVSNSNYYMSFLLLSQFFNKRLFFIKTKHTKKNIIMKTVKCLLIVPNPESALNEEAGKLLLENYEDYAKHARMMTKVHAQNKIAEFSSNINNNNNNCSTTSTSTTTISSTTSSTSSPKKFSSQMMMKTTSPQTTTPTTATMMSTNSTNPINNSSIMNIPASIAPLTVSNSMNESKSNVMNNGGTNNNNNLNHLKKTSSMSSNDNQFASNNPTVTPKKRAGDKKLDKKQADKKRSLKRL